MRRLLPILLLTFSACATAPDVAVPLPEDYAAREASASMAHDRCGPEFLQQQLPGFLVSMVGPMFDGPFRPVCERHDACYRLTEKSQAWCDDRMKAEMDAICAEDVGPLCEARSDLYYSLVNSWAGAEAYGGAAAGEITDVQTLVEPGQISYCAVIFNPSKTLQQYRLHLTAPGGVEIDNAPTSDLRNVRAGEQDTLCVGTSYTPDWTADSAGPDLSLTLLANRPDETTNKVQMEFVDGFAPDAD